MSVCFMEGCRSRYVSTKQGQAHLFKFPKSADKNEWIRNIPRGDTFDWENSRLCHLHFEESCLFKNEGFIVIRGKRVSTLTRPKWWLKPDAVPTKFLTASTSGDEGGRGRKRRRRRAALGRQHSDTDTSDEEARAEHWARRRRLTPTFVSPPGTQHLLDGISLPDFSWTKRLERRALSSTHMLVLERPASDSPAKSISVNGSYDVICIAFEGKDVTHLFPSHCHCETLRDVQNLVNLVQDANSCTGVPGYTDINICIGGIRTENGWKSSRCEGVATKKLCCSCVRLQINLRAKRYLDSRRNRS